MVTVSEALERGDKWFADHREHVLEMVEELKSGSFPVRGVKPSGADLGRPELWKDIHWVWFLEN